MTPEEERLVRAIHYRDRPALEAARDEVEGYLRQLCAHLARHSSFRPRFVEARVKSVASILRKLDERGASVSDLYKAVTDLVQARVVVYNLSDAEAFRDELLRDESSPIDDASAEAISYPTGYRAIHVDGRLGEYGCEMQIRTVVQDAWAVTSRADMYRGDDNELLTILSRAQASIMGGVDDVLQAIRDLTEKSRSQQIDIAEPEPTEHAEAPVHRGEGLDHSRIRDAQDALPPEEQLVLAAPISEARVQALKAGIESDRESSGVRRLFRAVAAYERRYEYLPNARFGNRMHIWKGPFVEGSNWVQYQPSDFSRGLEQFLLFQLGQLLSREAPLGSPLGSWDDVATFTTEAIAGIEQKGGHAHLVVIQGGLDQSLDIDVLKNADWSATPAVRGVDLSQALPIRGVISGLPLLRVHDRPLPPSMHVVDLTGVRYVQTNPDAMNDDDLLIRVEPIKWELAVETIDRNPELAASLYRSTHNRDGRFNREEAVVHLQLQVRSHLVEGGLIEARQVSWRSAALASG